MIMYLAELNGLDFWSTDIGNTYLESNTMEKIYIIGGKRIQLRWIRRTYPCGRQGSLWSDVKWMPMVGSPCECVAPDGIHPFQSGPRLVDATNL
jgi:hypothetical protein